MRHNETQRAIASITRHRSAMLKSLEELADIMEDTAHLRDCSETRAEELALDLTRQSVQDMIGLYAESITAMDHYKDQLQNTKY